MKNHSMNIAEAKQVTTRFGNIPVHTFPLKVKDAVFIHYVAARSRKQEEGAVQIILNKTRIIAIKEYILEGNNFLTHLF